MEETTARNKQRDFWELISTMHNDKKKIDEESKEKISDLEKQLDQSKKTNKKLQGELKKVKRELKAHKTLFGSRSLEDSYSGLETSKKVEDIQLDSDLDEEDKKYRSNFFEAELDKIIADDRLRRAETREQFRRDMEVSDLNEDEDKPDDDIYETDFMKILKEARRKEEAKFEAERLAKRVSEFSKPK